MLKAIAVVLFVGTILPAVTPAAVKHYSKSCYEYRGHLTEIENGFYTLYDENQIPFTTYCDFESDAPFAWTLIESMSLEEAQKTVNRKSFNYDHPLAECHMTWKLFRLSKARIDVIKSSEGTSHYRATCNFNAVNGTGIDNRIDYLRGEICANANFFKGNSTYTCALVDYLNVRGKTCRKCRVAYAAYDTWHSHIDLTLTATSQSCDRIIFPSTITGEDVFGHYANTNPTFSCATESNSTTQWWIGGAWIAAAF